MRIGVLYPNGSLNVMRTNNITDAGALAEAVVERDAWNAGARGHNAYVVSIDLNAGDVVVLGPEDFK